MAHNTNDGVMPGLAAPERPHVDARKDDARWLAGTLGQELGLAARRHPGMVILVSNEVGWGIVPETPLSRLYRDLVGRVNQAVAAAADEAYLVVSGLPLRLK